jgi:hypothetical protein
LNRGVFFYSPYAVVCNFTYFVLQLIPLKVEWKGRKYTTV